MSHQHNDPGAMSGEEPAIDVFTLRPERSQIGMRLDRYVASELHDLSRTYLQALIDGGNVQVDGVVRRAAFKVTPGQLVTVTVPESTDVEIQPEDLPLQLLYVDRDVVVLDKPAGLVVHPAPGHASGTLVNALLHHFPDISISGSSRPGLVHRLDKDTSGVMVVARNDRAQQSLVRQWQARTVDKHYLALVSGVVEEDEATIDAPIARDPANRLRMAVRRDGKDAVSHFIVSERLARSTLLDVRIESGRTHQIRVHLAMIGHPVLGDAVYADARARHLASSLQCPRQFLHAASLTFDLPSGDRKTFVSPMPVDLVEVLDRARTEQR